MSTATPIFLTNADNYFFQVETSISIKDCGSCKVHSTKQAMINHVSRQLNMDKDELEDVAIIVRSTSDGKYETRDMRGCWSHVELEGKSIEQWLSQYIE